MAEEKARKLSIQLGAGVIRMCEGIRGHSSIVDQLERSATSVGANIHEAKYAHSDADLKVKLEIALKECYESEYWLELFAESGIADVDALRELYRKCGTIRRILIASLTTQNTHNQP